MKDKQDLNNRKRTGWLPLRFPLLLANLLQSFYSIVDMLVVSRAVEKQACRCKQCFMIGFIISSVCIGITMGGTGLPSIRGLGDGERRGRGDRGDLVLLSAFIAL